MIAFFSYILTSVYFPSKFYLVENKKEKKNGDLKTTLINHEIINANITTKLNFLNYRNIIFFN